MNHYPDGHNVGLGMVCLTPEEREIERLQKKLAAKTAECERRREDAERFSREADNLARMLRRGQWLAKKETGDTGIKVWAGQAYDLLDKYGRLGSPLRGEDAAIDAARKETL